MTQKRIKSLAIWLITISISFALIISNFAFYNSDKSNKNTIKINGYSIKQHDIENLTKQILYEKKYLNEIKKIDYKLNSIIKNNIVFNSKLIDFGFIITNKELLHTIFSIEQFKINGRFSKNLYKNYLEKKNITEAKFQEEIKKIAIQNKLKYYIKLINKDYNIKYNDNIKYLVYSIKNKEFYSNSYLKNHLINNYLNNQHFIKYIDLSIKNILCNIKINNEQLAYYNKKINEYYNKRTILKIKCILVNKEEKNIFLTKNEIQVKNKNLFNFENNNNVINLKNHTFKLIKTKFKKKKSLNNDLCNKYKKQKAYNYIKKHAKKLLNKNIDYMSNLLNLNVNTISQHDYELIFSNQLRNINNDNCVLFKIGRLHYLFASFDKNSVVLNNINSMVDNYFNKINNERLVLHKFLKIKKNYTEKYTWKNIFFSNAKIIFPDRIIKYLFKSYKQYILLKYKNNYYIIKRININNSKPLLNYYSKIKMCIKKENDNFTKI